MLFFTVGSVNVKDVLRRLASSIPEFGRAEFAYQFFESDETDTFC